MKSMKTITIYIERRFITPTTGSAVFISDLASEPQVGVPKLHERIHREVIKSGHGSLDDGDRKPAGGGDRTSRF